MSNTAFKNGALWLLARDNKLSGMREVETPNRDARQGGDTVTYTTFYGDIFHDHFQVGPGRRFDDSNAWYNVGNIFRNNQCADGDVAAEVAIQWWCQNVAGRAGFFAEEKGMMMSVIENNTFDNVAEGINIANPAYWTLIRNNTFDFTSKQNHTAQPIVMHKTDEAKTNYRYLFIVDEVIIEDPNRTTESGRSLDNTATFSPSQ